MLLAVCILSGIFIDIQAHYANETDTVLHEIHKRNVLGSGQRMCPGMSVPQCARKRPRLLRQCKICGLVNKGGLKSRFMIIKGQDVSPPFKYPWMVVLLKKGKKSCGGAIISDRYILTAAHCITKTFPGKAGKKKLKRFFRPNEIRIGFLTKTDQVKPGPPLAKIIPHPGFHPKNMLFDVALLKLSRKITCSMLRNPICLPTYLPKLNYRRFKRVKFQISGWGAVSTAPKRNAKVLQEGRVRMTTFSECMPHISNPAVRQFIRRNLDICVKGVKGRPCFGDSGGSLFTRHRGKYVTVGVASFHTCKKCSAKKPAVYTNIRAFVPWIRKFLRSPKSRRRGYLSTKTKKTKGCKQIKKQCKQKKKQYKQEKKQCKKKCSKKN